MIDVHRARIGSMTASNTVSTVHQRLRDEYGLAVGITSFLPWGGSQIGHAGIAAFATALVGTIDSALTIDALFETDRQVIQTGRIRGAVRASGATFDIPEVHTWTIRNDKAVAAHFAYETPTLVESIGRTI